MREAVGSTFLFNIMIVFIFFFAGFLAIAINYSQAFRIKNQVINLIEQYEGVNSDSREKIFNTINSSGYYRNVNCDCSEISCNNVSNPNANGTKIRNGNKSVNGLCVKRLTTGTGSNDVYYRVTTYVNFNLPVIGNFITMPVKGETKVITNNKSD